MATIAVSQVKHKNTLDVRVILAFAAIYVLWGSTYLAIRIAVQQVPPLFAAGIRFFLAGTLLYAAMRLCGRPRPVGKEWGTLALLGSLMFVVTYGAVFWAEQYVPSGFTSVLEATLPLITIGLEVFVFRQQRFRWSLLLAIAVGFVGVLLLLCTTPSTSLSCPARRSWEAVRVVVGGRAHASLLLPKSKGITAGGEMMLGGAILLILSASFGEMHPSRIFRQGGGCPALPGGCRLADRFQRLCLATRPHACDPRRQPCLHQSRGGGHFRVLLRWGSRDAPHAPGHSPDRGQRRADPGQRQS